MSDIHLDISLLEELLAAPGLPGREGAVADVIEAAVPAASWRCRRDALGNLVAHLPGKGKKIILLAHMDSVGLIVYRITPAGFLTVERMGGMNVQAMPGSPVQVWTEKGQAPGVVGILPQHLDNGSPYEIAELFIDIGATSRQEAQDMGVRAGDGVTWAGPLQRLGRNRISGKYLDDRLGCLVLIQIARLFDKQAPDCDLSLAFVVQEETTLMGGVPVINHIQPDLVIGVDGTLAFDTPDIAGQQSEIVLGQGPAIKWMDKIPGKGLSYVPDRDTAVQMRSLAARNNLPLQDEVVVGLSTALNPLPYAVNGIRTLGLSLPIRYHHAPSETADLRDVEALVHLLELFLSEQLS
jgi:putative aminopeptidase FrvX